MASLMGLKVADKESSHCCGAAFLLSQNKINYNGIIQVNNSWDVVVGSSIFPYVIARGNISTSDTSIIKSSAYNAVQQAFDLLSIESSINLSTAHIDNEYILWWKEKGQQYIRFVFTNVISIEGEVEAFSVDKEGNMIKIPTNTPVYDQCLRYYRLSQTTDDLYDSFRNMYLCFELLLSSYYRRGRLKEGEWIKTALAKMKNQKEISEILGCEEEKVAEIFHKRIYKETRCKMFHAKKDLAILLPNHYSGRRIVQSSLFDLGRIVILMANEFLGVEKRSVFTEHLFNRLVDDHAIGDFMVLSKTAQDVINNSKKGSTQEEEYKFPVKIYRNPSYPQTQTYSIEVDKEEIRKIDMLSHFNIVSEKGVSCVNKVKREFSTENIEKFQIHINLHYRNGNLPNIYFKK
ncbi:MAG TPA: hypothetical protein DG757_09125 [Bacillus sp. (in: Bacteria)]|uniref:Uncharacterized protein n=1 Tax=Anoxybacillus andreesenii TaxID=1325932 RepID=A0ABT9V9N2_9BACL|nr:methylamine utilization protein MauJ [Robertmurraya andreesenii]MDQ0157675.1 hypothetical protein [Robertmurraya andreesenii]HCX49179.1 hypothetical protein [Bacillus sp. (in: firmicutes)]